MPLLLCATGAFVLFNVYGPAISTEERAEERYAFKLRFYEVGHSCVQQFVLTALCGTSISSSVQILVPAASA